MKQHKAIILLVSILALAVLFCGCDANGVNPPANPETENPDANNFDTNNPNNMGVNDARSQVPDSYRLYFANPAHDALISEERQYTGTYTEGGNVLDMMREVVDALIMGPNDTNNRATVTKNSKVNFIRQEDDETLHIDFNDGFIDQYNELGTYPDATIQSIIATLTQFEPYKRVRLTMDNQPLDLDGTVYDSPLERDEAWHQK